MDYTNAGDAYYDEMHGGSNAFYDLDDALREFANSEPQEETYIGLIDESELYNLGLMDLPEED